jgi:hypothetical protein
VASLSTSVDGSVVGDQLDHVAVHVDLDRHQLAVDRPELDRQLGGLAVDVHVDRSVVGDQLDHVAVHVDLDRHQLAVDRPELDR